MTLRSLIFGDLIRLVVSKHTQDKPCFSKCLYNPLRACDHESKPRLLILMADSVPLSVLPPFIGYTPTDIPRSAATTHYPPASYYSTPHMNHDPVRILSQPARNEANQQRKRPKYTRSKTGCLTCRVKKIKVRLERRVISNAILTPSQP